MFRVIQIFIFSVVDLRGIKVFYQKIQSIPQPVTFMKTLTFNEYGLKIHVPPNVSNDEDFSVTVVVGLQGSFQVPHETELVSAIYYIEASSQLFKPLVLEIEHCVIFPEGDGEIALMFGKADVATNTKLPYNFTNVSDGHFTKDSFSGSIETLTSHSLWGIFMVDEKYPVKYTAWPLICELQQGHYKVHIVAFRNLKAKKMVIMKLML